MPKRIILSGKSHEQYYSTLNHVLSVIQGKAAFCRADALRKLSGKH
jgi:hypothetical protein